MSGSGQPKDANDARRIMDSEALRVALDQARVLDPAGRGEPMPLRRELPPAQPYPLDVLGDILGGAAREAQRVIQAPHAICGSSLLGASALAAQPFADILIDGRQRPLSLMLLTIALTGERKTAVDEIALAEHRQHEKKLAEYHADEHEQYLRDVAAYEKTRQDVLNKGKTLADRQRGLDELGPAPDPPQLPMVICEEPSYEGLVKYLAVGQPSIGLFSDEGGRFIGGYAMNSDNMLKTAAGLCGLWDGKAINRVRVADGMTMLYGRRVSFHLMAQPGAASLLLSSPILQDQGVLSRMLTSWPDSTMGERPYREENLFTSEPLKRYWARCQCCWGARSP